MTVETLLLFARQLVYAFCTWESMENSTATGKNKLATSAGIFTKSDW